MAALGEYTNVYNTALNLLVRRGYQVWHEPDTREYCAEKDGWDFRGMTPLALLGAVAVYDPRPYTPVYKRPR